MSKEDREANLTAADIHTIKTLGGRVLPQDLAACLNIAEETVLKILRKRSGVPPVVTRKGGIKLYRLRKA